VQHSLNVYRKNPLAIRTLLAASASIRDPRLRVETFPTKTLVIWGERDNLVPRWAIDELMPRLPDATLVVHPEGGHQLQHDFPEWTSQKISEFLDARLDNS
jgi:pimeloyl-ACP methyl ester carboxylesterase